jgi:DEAD/DEAH box helicase domain-containing protein
MARRSSSTEATYLFTELLKRGVRTLLFARTRKMVELLYLYARDRLRSEAPALLHRISPYRAGYLPEERRSIEQALFRGELLGVTATNALELGIDIGDLDATILTGYPGSIASIWQQAGRSGRRGERSLSILIGMDNPLDQYLMRHPEAIFGKPVEHAHLSSGNPYILGPHLLCSAYELPLSKRDGQLFGEGSQQRVEELEREGLLHRRGARWFLSPSVLYPAEQVSIRSTSSESYLLVEEESGRLLESIDPAVVFLQAHPGAIYLHQGESYLVTRLDRESRTAHLRPATEAYYTQATETTDIRILQELAQRQAGGGKVFLGLVNVERQVVSFKRKKLFTEEVISEEPLDLPPQSFHTVAFWWDIPSETLERILTDSLDLAGGLHAAEHTAIGVLPLFALCDRNDIGGVSTPLHPDTGQPQVFIYDGHPGGVGISEKGFELVRELWQATLRVLKECPCEAGCPSCVQSPKCGNNNQPLDKHVAAIILEGLLGNG